MQGGLWRRVRFVQRQDRCLSVSYRESGCDIYKRTDGPFSERAERFREHVGLKVAN